MVQMYEKEPVLADDKFGYEDPFKRIIDNLNKPASHDSSYASLLLSKYADDWISEIGLIQEQSPHTETKINMEKRIIELEKQLRTSNQYIAELRKQMRELMKSERLHLDSLWQQNDLGRKELMSIFGIDVNDTIDVKKLDGLLGDYVDQEQDSRDLVRSIRGG